MTRAGTGAQRESERGLLALDPGHGFGGVGGEEGVKCHAQLSGSGDSVGLTAGEKQGGEQFWGKGRQCWGWLI